MNTRLTSNGDEFSQRSIDLILSCTMVLLGMAGWVSYLGYDKDALFVEAMKVLVPLGLGGVAGYLYARHATRDAPDGPR